MNKLVMFTVEGRRYGVPLDAVVRVERAVAITPAPSLPDQALGTITVRGKILPVFSVRRLLRHPEKPIGPDDEFVIIHTADRTAVLVVDHSDGVTSRIGENTPEPEGATPIPEAVEETVQTEDGMVSVINLDHLLAFLQTPSCI